MSRFLKEVTALIQNNKKEVVSILARLNLRVTSLS